MCYLCCDSSGKQCRVWVGIAIRFKTYQAKPKVNNKMFTLHVSEIRWHYVQLEIETA